VEENQVYASTAGQIITIRYGGKSGKDLDGDRLRFDVTVDDKQEIVVVAISGTAESAIRRWLTDPKNYGRAEESDLLGLATDLSVARIVEAVDRGIDFKADRSAYPKSFVKVFDPDFQDLISKRRVPNPVIKDYIIRRLYAAWKVGGESIEYAQLFDRRDELYLRATERDLRRVIDLYKGQDWTMEADDTPLLRATRELIIRMEESQEDKGAVPARGVLAGRGSAGKTEAAQEDDSQREWEYDVALSFAGENRDYVEEVAEILKAQGIKVFYDRYEEVDFWGRDLQEHLTDVYQNKARYVVMFVSEHYAAKVWTTVERRSAQARAINEPGRVYILPARFDDTKVPGLLPTVDYVDLRKKTPQQLADMIVQKVRGAG
jgi:hypothetical protein